MHDTTVDGVVGETIRNGWNAVEQSKISGFPVQEINRGLWPAVEEFLRDNTDWSLKERYTNNNGFDYFRKVKLIFYINSQNHYGLLLYPKK